MELIIESTYTVSLPKKYVVKVEYDIAKYLQEIKEEEGIYNKGELEGYIQDILWQSNFYFDDADPDDKDTFNDSDEVKILNLKELVDAYSFLIGKRELPTCCQQAPAGSKFCNTCGKYLK